MKNQKYIVVSFLFYNTFTRIYFKKPPFYSISLLESANMIVLVSVFVLLEPETIDRQSALFSI